MTLYLELLSVFDNTFVMKKFAIHYYNFNMSINEKQMMTEYNLFDIEINVTRILAIKIIE